MTTAEKNIVIVGGGIIGCTTAYFLTRHPSYSAAAHGITLLEASSSSAGGRTPHSIKNPASLLGPDARQTPSWEWNTAHEGIAGGASGKAGGLLALWAFPKNIVPLSFQLHADLAREHAGDKRWGYRRCWASQIECRAQLPPGLAGGQEDAVPSGGHGASKGLHKDHKKDGGNLSRPGAPADLDWVQTMRGYEGMGTPNNTAQVHPELFTRSMAQLAEEAGVKIITGARVTSIGKSADGKAVENVVYVKDGKEETMTATHCVVACGPWTSRLLPQIPVKPARAHSVVIKVPRPVSAYALFTSMTLPPGFPAPVGLSSPDPTLKRTHMVEPEIYARPDDTAYACGPTDEAAELPLTNAEVEVDEARCDDIARQVGAISHELGRDGEIIAKQACYLPQGGPFIGEVGVKGLIVAAGHTCWGIQNAPATGKLVSELVLDGKVKSAQLGNCDPARLL